MVEKVVIRNNENSPLSYLKEFDAFKNGTEYKFRPGVNIIVGKNGCGKTTLLKLIEKYLIVGKEECSVGMFNSNISSLVGLSDDVPDGVEVYADYDKNTFRFCHFSEKNNDDNMINIAAFAECFTQMHSSVGEGVKLSLNTLFRRMFSKDAKLKFDYKSIEERIPSYKEYVEKCRVNNHDAYTILMDEPDRNLDLNNIEEIKAVLSYKKPKTQIIAVIHNPLLLYSLSKNKGINFIEMTKGYMQNIKRTVDKLTKTKIETEKS